ncbi:LysR family transcriptional regulator [Serratia rubidaea]|uniref:LysR family transcriptional regulator n=1 Tax=Serratia rubidaea TaxID=61652 RepID=UPI003FA34FA8
MNLKEIEIFLQVAQTGSLTQAAHRLDMSPMSVSRRLAALEASLGVRLLHRTTRAVSLTPEGAEFMPYARTILEAEQSARVLFSSERQGAGGQLRVTAPSGLGQRILVPLIPTLLAENPEMKVDLQLSDEVVDIVAQGFDVAIRVAPLRDSNLIARKIADNPRVLCAAPAYLQQHGRPNRLADLARFTCLRLSNVLQWTFCNDGQTTGISIDGRFSCSSVEGVRTLCKAGLGLAQLTHWDIREELRRGELVALELQDVQPQALAVWALFPSHRYLPLRVGVFLDALMKAMR